MSEIEVKIVEIDRAGSVGDSHPPILTIRIDKQISDDMSLDKARLVYTVQGCRLADDLLGSLPGGTVDALIQRLLEKRASLFSVPFFSKNDSDQEISEEETRG